MKVNKESSNILNTKINELKKIIPEVFTENKIDFDKFSRFFKENISNTDEKYTLNWAGKSEAIKNIKANSTLTIVPVPDDKESINFNSTKNIFIEGDNLEVLKLLHKSYFNQIKMIYIDPPYNTGKDFVYCDNFTNSLNNYLDQTGQTIDGIKQTTNLKSNGRYHSDWLSMIYPRIFISHSLLKDDGVIFISIDDNEFANLKLVMDEIFGEENFTGVITRKIHTGKYDTDFSKIHDYILIYKKNSDSSLNSKKIDTADYILKDEYYSTRGPYKECKLDNASHTYNKSLDYIIKTPYGEVVPGGDLTRYKLRQSGGNSIKDWNWMWGKEKLEFGIKNGFIIFKNNKNNIKVYYKRYAFVDNSLENIIRKIPTNSLFLESIYSSQEGTKDLRDLFEGYKLFDSPKSVKLMEELLLMGSNSDDLVLDFFAGSGTLAHAVLNLNRKSNSRRKFICVQMSEKIPEKSIAYKKGYKTISDICKERIRRVIKKIKSEPSIEQKNLDLGFKAFKLSNSNYSIWNEDIANSDDLKKQIKLFESALISNYKDIDVLYEILIKEGYSLNAKIDTLEGKSNIVYKISDNLRQLYVCLDKKINANIINELKLTKEDIFVCLDSALDDSFKLNLSKILKSNEFNNNLRTI